MSSPSLRLQDVERNHGVLRAGKGWAGQFIDSSAAKDRDHGPLRLRPDGMGRTPGLTVAGMVRGEADVEPDRSFDGFHNLEHGCRSVCVTQLEPAGVSSVREDESCPRQVL